MTYHISEILDLIEGASHDELAAIMEIVSDECREYTREEMLVIQDHISTQKLQLEANFK